MGHKISMICSCKRGCCILILISYNNIVTKYELTYFGLLESLAIKFVLKDCYHDLG